MARFIEGEDRRQSWLLPSSLDDYVAEDNSVRVVEAYIDELDLGTLGFVRVEPASTGRPAYDPATLLKLYLYGYLNRVPSSRRLEREAQRNVEVMWLMGRLAPDHKTIALFRRDNGPAIQAACRQFVALCRELGLFAGAAVAIDGSKFKAVNKRDRNFTVVKVAKRLEQVDASIARYLAALDRADKGQDDVPEAKVRRIDEKIAGLRRQMSFLRQMQTQVEASDGGQVSLTDLDARSMATSGRGTDIVGYNVQIAVDPEHHFVVAHDVVNEGHDRTQLVSMGAKAREAIGAEEITVVADRGYYNGEQVLACEGTCILPVMPRADTSGHAKKGLFVRADFTYDPVDDHYVCPAGALLTKAKVRSDRHGDIDHYRNLDACHACAMRERCTPEKVKRMKRWRHEGVLEAMQKRLDVMPDAMAVRRATVEHVFGTLKAWLGATPFLTKGLGNVRTEISLAVLAYNMKRMIRLFGTVRLIEAIRA